MVSIHIEHIWMCRQIMPSYYGYAHSVAFNADKVISNKMNIVCNLICRAVAAICFMCSCTTMNIFRAFYSCNICICCLRTDFSINTILSTIFRAIWTVNFVIKSTSWAVLKIDWIAVGSQMLRMSLSVPSTPRPPTASQRPRRRGQWSRKLHSSESTLGANQLSISHMHNLSITIKSFSCHVCASVSASV